MTVYIIDVDETPTGVLPSGRRWHAQTEEGCDSTSAIPDAFFAGASRPLRVVPMLALATGAIAALGLQWVDISGARDVYESRTRPGKAVESEPGVVSELLSIVRRAFGGSVADLAAILNVRRPTIYAWMDGKSAPQLKNRARLDEIATLAKYWTRTGRGPATEFLASRPADARRLRQLLASEELHLQSAIDLIDELVQSPPLDTSIEAMIRRHGLQMPSEEERRERLDRETGKRVTGE
jgi:hypothetical protein